MSRYTYLQTQYREPTMTVGQLIERLRALDPSKPVVFRTPTYGVFGSNHTYTIDDVKPVVLEREEIHYPGGERKDEETGAFYVEEPYTAVKYPWDGVVIG